MKLAGPRILDWYVGREVATPFALGVGLLTFALVTGRLLKLTELVVNHGVTLMQVVKLLSLIMPAFLELTLPMAVLLGVLLGFGRMSGDRELTAARACGVSLYRLAAPVMAVAVVIWALSSWFAFSLRPWAGARLRDMLYQMTRTQTTAALKEKVFNSSIPGLVLYVDEISPRDQSLRGVLISDARDPKRQNTIIAHRGVLIPDERERAVILRLFDGSIFGTDQEHNGSFLTRFRIYDLSIRPDEAFGIEAADPKELGYAELSRVIAEGRASGKRDFQAETEMASKYTVPVATLLFAVLGMPLGLKPARGGQSERFGVSVALFFLYYALMRVGQTLAQRGSVNAYLAMSIPDVVFAVLACALFYRSANDRGDQGRGLGDLVWDLVELYGRGKAAA